MTPEVAPIFGLVKKVKKEGKGRPGPPDVAFVGKHSPIHLLELLCVLTYRYTQERTVLSRWDLNFCQWQRMSLQAS